MKNQKKFLETVTAWGVLAVVVAIGWLGLVRPDLLHIKEEPLLLFGCFLIAGLSMGVAVVFCVGLVFWALDKAFDK
jgi:hypothetical protein